MMRFLPILALLACEGPDTGDAFTVLDMHLPTLASETNAHFVDVVNAADTEVRVALPGLTDPDLVQAIVDAHGRDVDVRVVVDFDNASDAGVQDIMAAGVETTLADDGFAAYDFSLLSDVAWTSEQTQMTHAFAVADITQVVMATSAGDMVDAPRVVFSGVSEDIGEDLVSEHIQVFGGSDAVSKTAFDASAKSVADNRWQYATQSDEMFELWLGPQERVVKRYIDAVYMAKGSIRVMTEDIADEGFARALQHKAEDGFDIEVIVGSGFGLTNGSISEVLRTQAPDVTVLQSSSTAPLPTLMFVDFDRSPHDNRFHMPMAMVSTHPIWSASRLYNDAEVVTDQLCDGALYVLATTGEPTTPLQQLAQLYFAELDQSSELP